MKKININRKERQQMRHQRIINKFKKIQNTKLRLVFAKSNAHIYAQIIDDSKQHTLVAYSTVNLKTHATISSATEVGKKLAELAIAKNITTVAFDRGGNKYHGQIKAFADAARAGGLKF
ncbi:MAG: 50S ribosomal protein L18 [Mycoplasmataceae bacterium]|jgi:large subunit ribosomal protein L18|nr:50S ribosomal protein L18 [Mycoplasmataceae bacterium]